MLLSKHQRVYYGGIVSGLPHGYGILLTVDSSFESRGIEACWTEGEWQNGAVYGDAIIKDYYSSDCEVDWLSGLDISCTFGTEEIMEEASVTVWNRFDDEEHLFTYHVSNGKVSDWNNWIMRFDVLLELPCSVHSDCGVFHYVSVENKGKKLFQNTHGWILRHIPYEIQHYMEYGLHGGMSRSGR